MVMEFNDAGHNYISLEHFPFSSVNSVSQSLCGVFFACSAVLMVMEFTAAGHVYISLEHFPFSSVSSVALWSVLCEL